VTVEKIDIWADLSYGVLLAIGIGSMMLSNNNMAAVTFGLGVLFAYGVHVAWRMAHFNDSIEDRVETQVEESVTEAMEGTVEDQIEGVVEEQIEESIEENLSQ